MDFEKGIYIIGLIAYLIYSFSKGKKELEKKKKQQAPAPQPVYSEEKKEHKETSLDDVLKKFMDELEGKTPEQKKAPEQQPTVFSQPQFPKKEKKQKKKYIPPPVEVQNYESQERLDAESASPSSISFQEIKEFAHEQESESQTTINLKDAVIYSVILNRPYQWFPVIKVLSSLPFSIAFD